MDDQEKAGRKRDRMIEKAREYTTGTYKNRFVSVVFQRMIRAEAAVRTDRIFPAIVDGQMSAIGCNVGECVCVTCGKVGWWKGTSVGGGVIETGHFVASRAASIIFEETNAHPQCVHCNRSLSGNQSAYRLWMHAVYGTEEIERLERLKNQTRQFTREELVDLRIGFKRRLDMAVAILKGA